MEKIVKAGKLRIATNMPLEGCSSCPAISGEMNVAITDLQRRMPINESLKANVSCHPVFGGEHNRRHIDITFDVAGSERKASDFVPHWDTRLVHCNIT